MDYIAAEEIAKMIASDGTGDYRFGNAVSSFDDILVVAAEGASSTRGVLLV